MALPANDESGRAEFEERVRPEFADDIQNERHYQHLQIPVADVSGRDQEQLRRLPPEDVRVHKVGILRDDRPLLPVGQVVDLRVGRPVTIRQSPGCGRRRTRRQSTTRSSAAVFGRRRESSRTHRLDAAGTDQPGGKREHGQHVVTLEVFVVGQDLVDSHPRAEQFEKRLDRVAEPADARLAVAYRRVNRDPREKRVHASSIPKPDALRRQTRKEANRSYET